MNDADAKVQGQAQFDSTGDGRGAERSARAR